MKGSSRTSAKDSSQEVKRKIKVDMKIIRDDQLA